MLSCSRRRLQRMSDVESSSSYFAVEDPQWLCMVTLFVASLVTIVLYLVQYFQPGGVRRVEPRAAEDNAEKEEAASVLGWALSLESWKSQWRGAWCRALNDESRKCGVSLTTTVQDTGPGQVTSINQLHRGSECAYVNQLDSSRT